MDDEQKFAVLIDAENISPKYILTIFDEVSNYGVTTYRRIYGDWTSTANIRWKNVLLENSLTPIQQYSYTTGKNSSDSALIIDAMDILYTGNVNGFVLVSSDSDFTRLASRLRESGMAVIGMGESKTPKAFISACNVFKYLDILYRESSEEPEQTTALAESKVGPLSRYRKADNKSSDKKEPPRSGLRFSKSGQHQDAPHNDNKKESGKGNPQPQTKYSTIRRALKSIIQENSDDNDWISLANLGNLLAKRFPDFDVRNYGYKKLAAFIESMDDFVVEARPTSNGGTKQLFVSMKHK